MGFSTDYTEVLQLIQKIDPIAYGQSRNYVDGAVTRLSPYISRGVISTRQVMQHVIQLGLPFPKIEKLIQELAWRDYWQQVWIAKGDLINEDLKHEQIDVCNHQIPKAIVEGQTGIFAIDQALSQFYEDGYLHNHVRMYIASLACNIGKSHWRLPAKWMYYHLIDGDWASNALSWQWVAGANANKKYFANQENINKFCYTKQRGTFIDVPYEQFPDMEIPQTLSRLISPDLSTQLPKKVSIKLDPDIPTLIYNYYNLDPNWRSGERVNRVLLLEPSVFEKYPISKYALNFALGLAQNIPNIQIYVGEFQQLIEELGIQEVLFKEHPLTSHYLGKKESREWMFSVRGYFPSFFSFWKKCKKELKQWKASLT